MVFSVSSFCLGETTADPSPAREADSLPYNGDRAFLRSRNRKWEKGANLSGYTTQRIADEEAQRIVLSVSSFYQRKTTADPSVFSFFPEIFLFSPLTAQRSGCEWKRRSSGVNELCRLRSERTIRSLRRRAKKKDRKNLVLKRRGTPGGTWFPPGNRVVRRTIIILPQKNARLGGSFVACGSSG